MPVLGCSELSGTCFATGFSEIRFGNRETASSIFAGRIRSPSIRSKRSSDVQSSTRRLMRFRHTVVRCSCFGKLRSCRIEISPTCWESQEAQLCQDYPARVPGFVTRLGSREVRAGTRMNSVLFTSETGNPRRGSSQNAEGWLDLVRICFATYRCAHRQFGYSCPHCIPIRR